MASGVEAQAIHAFGRIHSYALSHQPYLQCLEASLGRCMLLVARACHRRFASPTGQFLRRRPCIELPWPRHFRCELCFRRGTLWIH